MVMVFNATFDNITVNIVVVSFIDGGTGVPGENHRPAASQLQKANQVDLKVALG